MDRVTARRRWALAVVALLIGAGAGLGCRAAPRSEAGPAAQLTPTPIELQFPTATATLGPPTETATRTPTSEGRPLAEAITEDTNVRSGPDINANRVALIYPGTGYPVLGKRFQWYMIEFPDSPNGIAWVHESVVTITGDPALIEDLELEAVPTVDPATAAFLETAAVITLTPGAIATQTAQGLITPTGVFTAGPGAPATLAPGQQPPTFTFPAQTPTPLVIPRTSPAAAANDDGGLPPIIPILALGSLGLLGLLVAIMRRL